jgi:hypothetical protein
LPALLGLTALAVILGFVVTESAALAGPTDLSTIVLSETVPGFTASPTGPTNGPLNSSNLKFFTGSGAHAALAERLATGDLRGYLRLWLPRPQNGDGVGIAALHFKKSAEVGAFLTGIVTSEQQAGGDRFRVPHVPGASGYALHTSTSGTPATEYAVAFARGNTVFEVEVMSSSGALTMADAVSVAVKQAASAPGSPQFASSPPQRSFAYRAGVVVGLVLLVLLVAGAISIVVRRGGTRRATPFTPPSPGVAGGLTASPSTSAPVRESGPPREIGWQVDADHMSEQAYWDGHRWTGRRRWSGAAWVDVQEHRPDHR